MAAIKEILEFEASREGEEIQRSVHLFQEGSFYRAYEWSAWLMCRYIHEFKVTHRRMKGVEQTVTLIGFPVTSLLSHYSSLSIQQNYFLQRCISKSGLHYLFDGKKYKIFKFLLYY